MSKITTKDIASICNVSQSTVSMILANKSDVSFSVKTRDKVLKAAIDLGYKMKPSEKIDSYSKSIAILVPNVSNLYYTNLIDEINRYSYSKGYSCFVGITTRDIKKEKAYLDILSKGTMVGIIYLYSSNLVDELQSIYVDIPIVTICDKDSKLNINTVDLDSKQMGIIAADHLLSLYHRNLAYVTTPLHSLEKTRNLRLDGIKQCIADTQHKFESLDVLSFESGETINFSSSKFEYLNGYELVKNYILSGGIATGFIAINDMVAIGIIDAIKDLKYKIPNDYSICGCDNIPLASTSLLSLTSIDHATDTKAIDAVDIIINQISLTRSKRRSTTYINYKPELIKRNSTGYNKVIR